MRTSVVALLLFSGVILGVRIGLSFTAPPAALVSFSERMAVVEGRVADDPDRRAASVRLTLEVERVNAAETEGKVLAVLPAGTEVAYGDRVAVRGVLTRPEPFATDTGRVFDYPGYLEARGISLLMYRAEVRGIERGGWSLRGVLFSVKRTFERGLERVMREPYASLMEGLLLGEKSGLPERLTDAFVATGLIHIVVLSGYNIGVVAEWVTRTLALLFRKRTALVVAGIIVVLFAMMAGGGMATARAALMGVIALIGRYLERPAAALRALVLAGALMVMWNPKVLVDVGFILSILATFGLITLSPWVETKLSVMRAGALRSVAATTIAVQLFILPALLYFTGVLSLVSIPLNLIVLPLVPLSMLLGFLAGALALLHPYLALLPGFFADRLLALIIGMTEAAAALPLAALIVPAFPAWVAWCAYVPLGALAMWTYSRTVARVPTS